MQLKAEEVNTATAYKMIRQGALLIDVREWEEVEMVTFNAEEVWHIPYNCFAEKYREIPVHREVIVGCRSGKRSLEAVLFLRQQGFQKVFNLTGGINDWISNNFPVSWDNRIPEKALLVEEKD
jgi:rhodanese-related sulfurtransferase